MSASAKKICIMAPTYKRVANGMLQRFVQSAIAKSFNKPLFCFCTNEKDTETLRYLQTLSPAMCEVDIVMESTFQPNLAQYFNLMYEQTRFNGSDTMASMFGDDMEFITEGWDATVLRETNRWGTHNFVWCNDDFIARERLCVNGCFRRELVEATTLPFMCPDFHADMIDVVWMQVGQFLGCGHYLPDTIIKHHHSTGADGYQWDDTFKRLALVQQLYTNQAAQSKARQYAALAAVNAIINSRGALSLDPKWVGEWVKK